MVNPAELVSTVEVKFIPPEDRTSGLMLAMRNLEIQAIPDEIHKAGRAVMADEHILDFYNADNKVLILREEGKIMGFSFLVKIDNQTYKEAVTAIRPEAQGKGLIKELHTAIRSLKDEGVKYLITEVTKGSAYEQGYRQNYQVETEEEVVKLNPEQPDQVRLKVLL